MLYHEMSGRSSLDADPPPPDLPDGPGKGPVRPQDARMRVRWPSGRPYRVGTPTGLSDRDIHPWLPEEASTTPCTSNERSE